MSSILAKTLEQEILTVPGALLVHSKQGGRGPSTDSPGLL